MKIVHTGDPGILSLRSDVVGCVVLAGLLLIVGGGLTLAFALDMIPIDASFNPDLENIVLAAGALGVMLGLIFVGGRSGKIFDSRRQSLISWSGLFVPMRHKEHRLEGYSTVVLVKEIHRSKNSSTPLFPVRLESSAAEALKIDTCTDYLKARRLAEVVAKVMRLPLTDSTSCKTLTREPDRLDESLRDRMRRLGERIEVSPRPHTMHSKAQVNSSEVVVDFPGMSAKARLIMNVVVIGLVLGLGGFFFGAQMIIDAKSQWSENWPMLLFAGLFVLIPLSVFLGKIRHFNRPVRVKANRVALIVTEGRKTTEIPGDELEELSISGLDISQLFQTQPDGSLIVDPNRLDSPEGVAHSALHGGPPTIPPVLAGIVRTLGAFSPKRLSILARSDRASVSFGAGLGSDEITYLYLAIMKVMVD
ncbi:MAG: hypothetical protein DRJ61_17955 [Acidobacteria bacterium]|nr:MAG: hypothetical protein DRJ61_17955 [Acidobacteriota bacterium]